MTLRLSLACGNYDRTLDLRTKDVRPEGIDFDYVTLPAEQTFLRQLRDKEFDVSEMSLAAYMSARAKGDTEFLALPVFPSRFFRHSAIYVNAQSRIATPQDLRGRRVGVGFYQMTTACWVRGFLLDDYGVAERDIEWITGASAGPKASAVDQLQNLVAGTSEVKPPLEAMLESGDIDALVTVHIPKSIINRTGQIRRLFEPSQPVEEEYFRRTRIFPIIHTLVMRRRIHDAHPWAANSVFQAFEAAKRRAQDRLYDTNALAVTLPSLVSEVEKTRTLMGDDYWPYGVEKNRLVLDTFIRYLQTQKVISEPLAVDDLFISLPSV